MIYLKDKKKLKLILIFCLISSLTELAFGKDFIYVSYFDLVTNVDKYDKKEVVVSALFCNDFNSFYLTINSYGCNSTIRSNVIEVALSPDLAVRHEELGSGFEASIRATFVKSSAQISTGGFIPGRLVDVKKIDSHAPKKEDKQVNLIVKNEMTIDRLNKSLDNFYKYISESKKSFPDVASFLNRNTENTTAVSEKRYEFVFYGAKNNISTANLTSRYYFEVQYNDSYLDEFLDNDKYYSVCECIQPNCELSIKNEASISSYIRDGEQVCYGFTETEKGLLNLDLGQFYTISY